MRPGWSPPRSAVEKDQLIEKLVHDNEVRTRGQSMPDVGENAILPAVALADACFAAAIIKLGQVLMKEVAELDAQLRQAIEEREAAVAANQNLLHEQQEQESTSSISERMQRAVDAQVELVRSEREELTRQHAADREFLNGVFRELEGQLATARTEREELQTRADRERRGSLKKIKDLEDSLAAATLAKDRAREQCDREKEVLSKQFEQRIAGLRLEKENAKLDKALLKRLESELSELKALSTSILTPLANARHHTPYGSAPPSAPTVNGLDGLEEDVSNEWRRAF